MARSARFGSLGLGHVGSDGTILSVGFEANQVVRLTDALTGYFLGGAFQRQVEEANHKMAVVVQEAMAESLASQIDLSRPQRPNHRLEMSLLNPENIAVTASGFIVGRPSWLDRSPAALYWRGIEEGIGSYQTVATFFNPGGPWAPGRGEGKHMRMPQWLRRGTLVEVKAFPGYHYMEAARTSFFRLEPAGYYLAQGVPISQVKSLATK